MKIFPAIFCALLLFSAAASAGPLEDAQAAIDRHDYRTAVKLLKPLAEQGNDRTQFVLGRLYERGLGVKRDYAQALLWYRKAADQGDGPARERIGAMYQQGLGVTQNYAEALKWYLQAADRGRAAAYYDIGLLYKNGLGVDPDDAAALKWFRLAAGRGNEIAQFTLGQMYALGQGGLGEDPVEAYFWLSLSEKATSDATPLKVATVRSGLLLGLKLKLTTAQLAAQDRRVARWKPEAAPAKETAKEPK